MKKILTIAVSLFAVSAFAAGVVFKANPLAMLSSSGGGNDKDKKAQTEQVAKPNANSNELGNDQVEVHKAIRVANAPNLNGVHIPKRFDSDKPEIVYNDFDYALNQNEQGVWSIDEQQARLIARYYPEVINSRHAVKLRQMYGKAIEDELTKLLQEKINANSKN